MQPQARDVKALQNTKLDLFGDWTMARWPVQLVTSCYHIFLKIKDLFAESSKKNAAFLWTSYRPQKLMICFLDSRETLLETKAFLAFK